MKNRGSLLSLDITSILSTTKDVKKELDEVHGQLEFGWRQQAVRMPHCHLVLSLDITSILSTTKDVKKELDEVHGQLEFGWFTETTGSKDATLPPCIEEDQKSSQMFVN
ncbi:hypothetical protein QE152_g27170 [Popillia japonica]|uniref:Uncharacterized protein n=1 Tax=Popillia japonica TaxID=7064 RepID=A0AAW1JW51_POPJA